MEIPAGDYLKIMFLHSVTSNKEQDFQSVSRYYRRAKQKGEE